MKSKQSCAGYIFPPLSKHHPNVLKPTFTNKIKPTITQIPTHITQLYIAGNFPIWPISSGSVEESGYQHAHLTIWTFLQLNQLYTMLAKQQTGQNTLK